MNAKERLANSVGELGTAIETLQILQEGCCQPARSPRMEHLQRTLARARDGVAELDRFPERARSVIAYVEDAGAQFGSLQVVCCAPARIPLYAAALKSLGRAQRLITQEFNLDH